MLEEARKRGVVEGLTNLFDEYWSNPETADACLLPYLEGDYWIGEAENIIKVRNVTKERKKERKRRRLPKTRFGRV